MEIYARLKSPFTALVSGPTGSGKTVLIAKLIANASDLSSPPPVEIIY
jgi:type IV secretory pathway VirB4 component